jgi:hypothetical protein
MKNITYFNHFFLKKNIQGIKNDNEIYYKLKFLALHQHMNDR